MDIQFLKRSKFLEACRTALLDLASGGSPVSLNLGSGGYDGSVLVKINCAEPTFKTDWTGKDKTRFPTRIRAAATALRDAGYDGSFLIEHRGGQLTIGRA